MTMPSNDNIEELKSIIKGLKLSGLAFVDQDALVYINQRIKNLPSSEFIEKISMEKDSIKKLFEEVGEIIKLIEIYGKRNEESNVRNISTKGLPQRYRILKWRQAMQNKNQIIRGLVNLSSSLDTKGHFRLASNTIKCANSIKEDKATAQDVEKIIKEINASGNEDIIKEAGWLQRVPGYFSGMGQAIKQTIIEPARLGEYKADLNDVVKRFSKLQDVFKQLSTSGNPQVSSAAKQLHEKLNEVANAFNSVSNTAVKVLDAATTEASAPTTAPATTSAPAATTSWQEEAKKAGWAPPTTPS